jgi:dimethylargininase
MAQSSVEYGPRLIGSPAGELRAAVLVRPSASIERATPRNAEPGAIYARALEQHAVLERTLRSFGAEVDVVDSFGDDPYRTAVADAAVVFENGAVMMRPSSMSRRGEAENLERVFASIDVPLSGRITPPALLDGTDVLLVDATAYVGVGARGNDLGRSAMRELAAAAGFEVVEVRLARDVASLHSVAGILGEGIVALAPAKLDAAAFSKVRVVALEPGEESAAGVICLSDRHVIVDVRYRTALRRMRAAGVTVEGIDLYEFEKLGITPSMLVLPTRRA